MEWWNNGDELKTDVAGRRNEDRGRREGMVTK